MEQFLLMLCAGASMLLPVQSIANGTQPHIFFIVADDLGWNDVSWRDAEMHTPVLKQLAQEGVILGQSYVQPVCSPSRAAFMSGYYPYHLGLQHASLRATQKAFLPGNIDTLPSRLKRLGYSTHIAGKWHLGFCNWNYTPTYRGFDSFVGFYNAEQDYYTHIGHKNAYDFRMNKEVYYDANGTYSAYVFTQRVEEVIASHDVNKPLFVYLPFQSVHGPLQVPDSYVQGFCSQLQNETRRTKCGMIAMLDEAVGNVTAALRRSGMLNNTLILFTTDNGGPVHHGANNWPLRGSKATLWEGGTRAMAFLHAPQLLKRSGTIYNGLIHAVDWLPTMVEAAGGGQVTGIDGISQWTHLVQGIEPSARSEFVYNIDELKKNSALRQGRYKLIQGNAGMPDGWYPPPQFDKSFGVVRSQTGDGRLVKMQIERQWLQERHPIGDAWYRDHPDLNSSLQILGKSTPGSPIASDLLFLQNLRTHGNNRDSVYVARRSDYDTFHDDNEEEDFELGNTQLSDTGPSPDTYQLFDLEADPTERTDVKDKYPDVYKQMLDRLNFYWKSLVNATYPPPDPDSNPAKFGGVWSPGWC